MSPQGPRRGRLRGALHSFTRGTRAARDTRVRWRGNAAHGFELGALNAYLQVDSRNDPARRLYREFGFVERYEYWYRGREGERQ